MTTTTDIIKNLVETVPLPFEISAVTEDPVGTFTIETCKTYYLQANTELVIDGITYKVVSVQNNESVVLEGSVSPSLTPFNLPAPHFFHGTIVEVNTEIGKEENVYLRTPMVFLNRPFPETVDPKAKRGLVEIERTADVVLYFLTQALFEVWNTDEHDLHAIRPMRNLMEAWIEWLEKQPSKIGLLDTYETLDMIRFGVLITDRGYGTALFDDDLSGVRLSITLPLKRECCLCCN